MTFAVKYLILFLGDNMGKIYFNTNLEFLRKQKGLTQLELAKMLGVSEPVISHWEIGKREPRNMEMVGKIAEIFGVGADIITKDLRLDNSEDTILLNKINQLNDKDKKVVSSLIDNLKD